LSAGFGLPAPPDTGINGSGVTFSTATPALNSANAGAKTNKTTINAADTRKKETLCRRSMADSTLLSPKRSEHYERTYCTATGTKGNRQARAPVGTRSERTAPTIIRDLCNRVVPLPDF
jgi:hypothetical protein